VKAARPFLLALIVWGGACAFVQLTGNWGDPWKVDEAQRISESYFLRLVEAGDFSNPDWFARITDSSHPPVNKYVFGLAIQLHGVELPRDLGYPRYVESGEGDYVPPSEFDSILRPMLVPSRRAAMVFTAATAGVLFVVLWEAYGLMTALLALVLFFRHYLTPMIQTMANSDSVQVFLITATVWPLWRLWRAPSHDGWRPVVLGVAAGSLSALAFQTRVSGLLALGGTLVVLATLYLNSRSPALWRVAAVAVMSCSLVSIAVNPYYWAQPRAGDDVPEEYRTASALPLRPIIRLRLQIRDLKRLLDGQDERSKLRTLTERIRFVAQVLSSGKAGLIAVTGALMAGGLAVAGRLPAWSGSVFLCVWGGSMIAALTVWLPLSWDKYVWVALPPLVAIGAAGWSEAVALVRPRGVTL
jgi:hypothetical protein